MKISLYIHRTKDLASLDNLKASRFFNSLDQSLLNLISKQGFDRLYFGSESCENCLPTVEAILRAEKIAKNKGLSFTLVTPICTEKGLDYLSNKILPAINKKGMEISCNDFGVLHFLTKLPFRGTIALGRLLAKSKKWPLGFIPPEFLKTIKHSPYGFTEYQDYLKQNKVKVIEIDNRAEGYDSDLQKIPFKIAMHIPFVYLTSGRMCFLAGQEKNKEQKFGISNECKQYCNQQLVEINDQFYSNGRTVYCLNNKIDQKILKSIDRLVISPNI